MLIWHCTDFVQLLGCNLNDIKTAITGQSTFMCSLIQSKAPSCFATIQVTHSFFNILSFVSSVDAKNFFHLLFPKKAGPCTSMSCTAVVDMDLFFFFGPSVAT